MLVPVFPLSAPVVPDLRLDVDFFWLQSFGHGHPACFLSVEQYISETRITPI